MIAWIPKTEGELSGPFVTASDDRFHIRGECEKAVIIEFFAAPAEAKWVENFELLYCQKQHNQQTIKVIRKVTEEERKRYRIPLWIQDEDIPECCGQPMCFVGQIDDDRLCTEAPDGAKMWWHDVASFYVFTCSQCLGCKAVGQQF